LTAQALNLDVSPASPGGLVIAGSYVPKTTAQLEALIDGRGTKLQTITLDVENLLQGPEIADGTIRAAANQAGELITKGEDVLVMTSRKLVTGGDELSSLKIGGVVAASLVSFLRLLDPRPRYIIAKVRSPTHTRRCLIFRLGRHHSFRRCNKELANETRRYYRPSGIGGPPMAMSRAYFQIPRHSIRSVSW
jgi:Nucleotide-binding C-terminal domain